MIIQSIFHFYTSRDQHVCLFWCSGGPSRTHITHRTRHKVGRPRVPFTGCAPRIKPPPRLTWATRASRRLDLLPRTSSVISSKSMTHPSVRVGGMASEISKWGVGWLVVWGGLLVKKVCRPFLIKHSRYFTTVKCFAIYTQQIQVFHDISNNILYMMCRRSMIQMRLFFFFLRRALSSHPLHWLLCSPARCGHVSVARSWHRTKIKRHQYRYRYRHRPLSRISRMINDYELSFFFPMLS